MSDTPRTDAAQIKFRDSDWIIDLSWSGTIVPADFARDLERELAASRMREYQHLQITIPELKRTISQLNAMANRYMTEMLNVVEGLDSQKFVQIKADMAVLDKL